MQCLFAAETYVGKDSNRPITTNDSTANAYHRLECITREEILSYVHHPSSAPPPICPCDCCNASNTKTTWTPEELHRITGCYCFHNYNHIIEASKDRTPLNNGKFPIFLGLYATILKPPWGKAIDWLQAKYLDIVHMDITFGDCLSIGGFKYALIFVDRASRYNLTFGLKSLQGNETVLLFGAFCDESRSLAKQFRCNYDEKLFGSGVWSFLHQDKSFIAASLVGRQSANRLVKSHWKIMVHMAHVYLMEKQMLRSFWYFAMKHMARMMNMIPGKFRNNFSPPVMLVHGVCPDQRAWLPLFLYVIFTVIKRAKPCAPGTKSTQ